jgi:hypothetical protein
MNVMHITSL